MSEVPTDSASAADYRAAAASRYYSAGNNNNNNNNIGSHQGSNVVISAGLPSDSMQVPLAEDGLSAAEIRRRQQQHGHYGRRYAGKVRALCCASSCCLLFAVLIFCVGAVLPTQFGLLYNYITADVDSNTVYRGGIRFVVPYCKIIKFPATLQSIEFSQFRVIPDATHLPPLMTRSPEGLPITLHVAFQYQLVRDELPDLYRKAYVTYEKLFVSNARDALLKAASEFKANEYWSKRYEIGIEFHRKVQLRLRELHAEVSHFEVLRIDLPIDWENKIVATQVAQQQIETERMKQQAAAIRFQTGIMQADYERNRMVIVAGGAANATYAVQAAQARANQRLLDIEAETLGLARETFQFQNSSSLVEFQMNLALSGLKNATFLVGMPEGASPVVFPAALAAAPQQQQHDQVYEFQPSGNYALDEQPADVPQAPRLNEEISRYF